MPTPLIPDQRPFFRRRFRLIDLQDAMQFSADSFERFLYLVRETAKEKDLHLEKNHSQQNAGKWHSLVVEMIKQEKKLEEFVDHWPIEVYFDFWTGQRASHPNRIQQRSMKEAKVKEVKEGTPLRKKRLSSSPLDTTTDHSQKLTQSVEPSSRTTTVLSSSARHFNQGNSVVPASAEFEFNGPYDKTIRQPCFKCGSVPQMVSRRLKEAFKDDVAAKGELIKMGIHSDVDLDTFVLMGSAERDELFRYSEVTSIMKVSIGRALKNVKGRGHVAANISEDVLRLYLAGVYTCPEHPALDADTVIPRPLRKLFNKCHIEHLVPAAIFLGVTTDAEYNKMVLEFSEEEREQVLSYGSELLSPIQKYAMKWAFGSD